MGKDTASSLRDWREGESMHYRWVLACDRLLTRSEESPSPVCCIERLIGFAAVLVAILLAL